MGLFNFFKHDINDLIEKHDVDGLNKILQHAQTNNLNEHIIAIRALGEIGNDNAALYLIEYLKKCNTSQPESLFNDSDIKEAMIASIKTQKPIAIKFVINILKQNRDYIRVKDLNLDEYSEALNNNPDTGIINIQDYFDFSTEAKNNDETIIFYKLMSKMSKKKVDTFFFNLRYNKEHDVIKGNLFKILFRISDQNFIDYATELFKAGEMNRYFYPTLSFCKDPRLPALIINDILRREKNLKNNENKKNFWENRFTIESAFAKLYDYDDLQVKQFFLDKMNNGNLKQHDLQNIYSSKFFEILKFLTKNNEPCIADHFSKYLIEASSKLSIEADDIRNDTWELWYRSSAIEYLGKSENPTYIPVIIPFLKDDYIGVREASATALENLRWNPRDKERVDYLFARKVIDEKLIYDDWDKNWKNFFTYLDQRDWEELLKYRNSTVESIIDLLYQIPCPNHEYSGKFRSICRDLFGPFSDTILKSAGFDRIPDSSGHGYVNSITSQTLKATKKLCSENSQFTTFLLTKISSRKNRIVSGEGYYEEGSYYRDTGQEEGNWRNRIFWLDFSPQREMAINELKNREKIPQIDLDSIIKISKDSRISLGQSLNLDFENDGDKNTIEISQETPNRWNIQEDYKINISDDHIELNNGFKELSRAEITKLDLIKNSQPFETEEDYLLRINRENWEREEQAKSRKNKSKS